MRYLRGPIPPVFAREHESGSPGCRGDAFAGALTPGPGGAPTPEPPATTAPILGFDAKAEADVAQAAGKAIVHIADKTFYRNAEGLLVDSLYDEARDKAKVVEVKAFSDDYFALLQKHPGIGRYLAEGKPMLLVFDGSVYRIAKAE